MPFRPTTPLGLKARLLHAQVASDLRINVKRWESTVIRRLVSFHRRSWHSADAVEGSLLLRPVGDHRAAHTILVASAPERRGWRMTRWARLASVLAIIGGAGFVTKVLLLSAFASKGMTEATAPPALNLATTIGLFTGVVLLPLGVTGLPSLWLRGRHWLVVAVAYAVTVFCFLSLGGLFDSALKAVLGREDPFFLRTEGSLLLLGLIGIGLGLYVRHALPPASRVGAPQPTQPTNA